MKTQSNNGLAPQVAILTNLGYLYCMTCVGKFEFSDSCNPDFCHKCNIDVPQTPIVQPRVV